MADNSIYKDIARRTGGDIYVGVVGPARTGKSTFIHRFIDGVVLPNVEDEYDKQRTIDQMPQSASGRTIMTTEPKFVPDESVRISLDEGIEFNVKLVDCVGYMTSGALGTEEGGTARMVSRFRPNINIIGITTDIHAYRQLALSWGVLPALTDEYTSIDILFYFAKQIAKNSGLVNNGDTIVITGGTPNGKSGNSNLINVETI